MAIPDNRDGHTSAHREALRARHFLHRSIRAIDPFQTSAQWPLRDVGALLGCIGTACRACGGKQ